MNEIINMVRVTKQFDHQVISYDFSATLLHLRPIRHEPISDADVLRDFEGETHWYVLGVDRRMNKWNATVRKNRRE